MNPDSVAPAPPLRALLLDDDPVILMFVSELLRSIGIAEVMTAENGEQGLNLLATGPIDLNLLVCDLQMPGMDGVEFLRHVAERGYAGDIILFSGVPAGILKAAERLAMEHGLHILGTLEKPVSRDALVDVLAATGQRATGRGASIRQTSQLTATEIRDGLMQNHLELFFQPKVSLRDRSFLGVEALARWRHPERGLLAPDSFIPVVEQSGLIDAFSAKVFQLAVAYQRQWLDRGRLIRINVNLSAENLRRIDLPEFLAAELVGADLETQHIVLEITESRLMSNLKVSLDILIRLRLKGFGLSIDDFGTGYSTMESLKQLPFSELKIDRAFVCGAATDGSERAILETSVRLGRKFDLNIVAEGVETQQDWDTVRAENCDEAQGYFIARPMPAAELLDWIQSWESMHAGGIR